MAFLTGPSSLLKKLILVYYHDKYILSLYLRIIHHLPLLTASIIGNTISHSVSSVLQPTSYSGLSLPGFPALLQVYSLSLDLFLNELYYFLLSTRLSGAADYTDLQSSSEGLLPISPMFCYLVICFLGRGWKFQYAPVQHFSITRMFFLSRELFPSPSFPLYVVVNI